MISAVGTSFAATAPSDASTSAGPGRRTLPSTPENGQPLSTDPGNDQAQTAANDSVEISPETRREIARLAQRDREVRAHEQAHLAAGGSLITSGPTYEYTTGPDNRRYAVGGEVGIDSSPVRGDPEATIVKAIQIRAAALAPADPSAADRQVAAKATNMEQRARLELAQQRREEAYSAIAGVSQREPNTIEAIA